MHNLLAAIAAAAACAMNGNPVIWSSFPVLLGLAMVLIIRGPHARAARRRWSLQATIVSTGIALGWCGIVTVLRFDSADAIAYVGGFGSLLCGYLLGVSMTGDSRAVSRVLGGAAIGYSLHAVRLLSWFVAQCGWSVSDWVQLRWNLPAVLDAALVGFGNLGNNAVLAATMLPSFAAMTVRPGDWKVRLVCFVASVLAVGVLVVTQARGPLVVAALVTALLISSMRARIALAILAASLGFAVLSPTIENQGFESNAVARLIQTIERANDDASVAERREANVEGWHLAGANPVLGVGVAGVPKAMTYTSPHQWHLHQAMEWGLIAGLAAAMATLSVIVAFAGGLWMLLRQVPGQLDLVLCLSIPCSYLLIATGTGAQWHYGLASAWPAVCGIAFGLACAVDGSRPSVIVPNTLPGVQTARQIAKSSVGRLRSPKC